mmetsp:Transcript_36776/g.68435  ORF Transcript_36776/g.68435 Transcript_36776/m.68435 type:complete len:231 (-) Transcript_36776:402-1094(-)
MMPHPYLLPVLPGCGSIGAPTDKVSICVPAQKAYGRPVHGGDSIAVRSRAPAEQRQPLEASQLHGPVFKAQGKATFEARSQTVNVASNLHGMGLSIEFLDIPTHDGCASSCYEHVAAHMDVARSRISVSRADCHIQEKTAIFLPDMHASTGKTSKQTPAIPCDRRHRRLRIHLRWVIRSHTAAGVAFHCKDLPRMVSPKAISLNAPRRGAHEKLVFGQYHTPDPVVHDGA